MCVRTNMSLTPIRSYSTCLLEYTLLACLLASNSVLRVYTLTAPDSRPLRTSRLSLHAALTSTWRASLACRWLVAPTLWWACCIHSCYKSVSKPKALRRLRPCRSSLPAAPGADPRPQWALAVLSHRSSIAYGRGRRLLHHLHDLPVLGAHSPARKCFL